MTTTSPIRMGGLVSGLDTETIVKNLMKAESAPLNKLLQKKQTEEWRRDQYREMNALLLDLKNKTLDMKLQGTYLKKVVSSDSDAIVSAKQKGIPSLSSYSVNVVTLPTAAKPASVKFTTTGLVDESTKIGETIDFKIGTESINITVDDTITSAVAKVNAVSSKTGVTANYMQGDKSITFTTTTTGANAKIQLSGFGGIVNKLGMSDGEVSYTKIDFASGKQPANVVQGKVLINDIPYDVNSSTFTFDGIEFNIKSVGTTQVNQKPDEEAVFKSIKDYVDKYNESIDKINTKITESTYRDYQPLLAEEKATLSDTQVKQWEEKAKSGLLRQDSLLSGALSQMRQSLSSIVKGTAIDTKYDSLSEIGITTGSYSEKGKLYIDETKLREAISQNGSKVMDLFTNASTSTDAATKFSESGLAQRLYDQLNSVMGKLTDKAGSVASLTDNSIIGKQLDRMNTDISKWESRLKDIEARYWKKFTSMETAMNKANSQSSWLTQQLGK
jgi:flagellar hook-associated protein 2